MKLNWLCRKRYLSTTSATPLRKQNKTKEKGFAGQMWSLYMKSLQTQPFLTKSTTAIIIFFTSDLGTQYLSHDYLSRRAILINQRSLDNIDEEHNILESDFSFDYSRALSGAAFGLIGTGWLHMWWGFLEKAVELRFPIVRYRLQNTLIKVSLDQSVGAPLYIYCYYLITSFLRKDIVSSQKGERNVFQKIINAHYRASDLLLPTLLKHWRVWPAIHTLNFYYVPLHQRVLVQNCALVGWSGYLSYLNNNNAISSSHLRRRETSNIGLDVVEEIRNQASNVCK